jgi:hypothetical protein
MAKMTDQEADMLDEFYTANPPKVDPAKRGGVFTRQRELLSVLDRTSIDYIMTQAIATKKMPAEIIGDMVRERIAALT